MYVNAELPYYKQYTPDMSYDELAGDARVYLHINLNGPYHDKEFLCEGHPEYHLQAQSPGPLTSAT